MTEYNTSSIPDFRHNTNCETQIFLVKLPGKNNKTAEKTLLLYILIHYD